jgi:hypothetical protein
MHGVRVFVDLVRQKVTNKMQRNPVSRSIFQVCCSIDVVKSLRAAHYYSSKNSSTRTAVISGILLSFFAVHISPIKEPCMPVK